MNDKSHGADTSLAASLAMQEAGNNPETKQRVNKYLDQQIALHELHVENLKLQNHALQFQHKQLRAQHSHDWLRTVYQSVLSVIAVAILGVIVYAVYTAATDHSVVVNQFQVPPKFVDAGENGTVVASEFLDQLQKMQTSALSSPDSRSLQGAWMNNIQLQVPDVHVSLGDIRHTLHSWLGHEIQINGEVVENGKQIAFTIRGTGFAARTYTGGPDDLQNLLEDAAEYVYVQAEPNCLLTISKKSDGSQKAC